MKDFKLDNQLKIQSGFKIPENYFDDLSEKIMNQLPKEKPKVISFWAKNKKWMYATAAVITLSISIPVLNTIQANGSELNSDTIENYLTSQSSISEDELADLLDMEDIKKIEINSNIETDALEEELSNNKNIEQYITN